MLCLFEITGTVKQFAYRTARVTDVFWTLDIDEARDLEDKLAAAAGVRRDNHTVYELSHNGNTIYIMFSDFHARFGWSIEKRPW